MWKPCYKYEKDLLVLARVARREDGSWHLCKAHISRGKSPSSTKVSQDFATRVGWLKSDTEGSICQPENDGQRAGDNVSEQPENFVCLLAVGGLQIEIVAETVDSPTLFESSAPFDKIEWHIHIGEEDMKVLERSGWDSKICYLDVVPQQGVYRQPPKCPSDCRSIADALSSGHADCMRYWHVGSIDSLAPGSSDRNTLQLYEPQYPSCSQAAQWPSAEVLMYAHDVLGLYWDECTTAEAAEAGSIDCLSFAHCSGCPWGASVCSGAARAGSMACLMYAHEHGCEWTGGTCEAAAFRGHLDCLVYARKHGCQWDETTCSGAAFGGNLKVLTYAFENGCCWDKDTCSAAAYAGSMECLVYAHKRGCPWDATTCEFAAAGRHLECLCYAHERGCSWDADTIHAATRAGDIECLMYAHQHDCPYDGGVMCAKIMLTCELVQGKMSLPCLRYLCESMDCGWDPLGTEWWHILVKGRCDVLEYVHLHGGAWCKEEELLRHEERFQFWGLDGKLDGRARCLLYMHCCGGCKLPQLRGTVVGERMLELMQERRAAVLLSFRAAGRARGGSRAADAAHAAMAMVPVDLVRQIICTAKLFIAD